jgi:aspartate dehydrogenase
MSSPVSLSPSRSNPGRDRVPVTRVGLVGFGAIGSVVGRTLTAGEIAGVELGGVLDPLRAPEGLAARDLTELIDSNDVIVEAAGPQALKELVEPVLQASKVLVAVSVGAFLSPELESFLKPGRSGGRLILTTGAISGLDLVRAARMADHSASVQLRSSKKPSALVQPWMTEAERSALETASPSDGPRTLFRGTAPEAARLFPGNLNVAAALAIAAGDVGAVEVELIADPTAERTRHDIRITSVLGRHHLELENLPSPDNAATSGLVPWAVLRCLSEMSATGATPFR